jgi:hypothetical protein
MNACMHERVGEWRRIIKRMYSISIALDGRTDEYLKDWLEASKTCKTFVVCVCVCTQKQSE